MRKVTRAIKRASMLAAAGVVLVSLAAVSGSGCKKEKGLRITGMEPKAGPYSGGDPVTISGNGFQSEGARGVEVWFGDRKGRNVRFRGDDELVVDPPPGTIGETVDVVIMFDDARQKVLAKAYTYIDPAVGFGVDELTQKQKKDEQ